MKKQKCVFVSENTCEQTVSGTDHVICLINGDHKITCFGIDFGVIPTGQFLKLYCGQLFCCAIERWTYSIHCFGGFPPEEGDEPPEGEFLEITGDGYNFCAINLTYSLVCWGRNNLDDIPIGHFRKLSFVDIGLYCTIAIPPESKIKCFGDDVGKIYFSLSVLEYV